MKKRLSASSLLFIENISCIGLMVCSFMTFICFWGAAGTSDFYSEISEDVPNHLDIKMLIAGLVFLSVACVCSYVLKSYDFKSIGKLENIPVFCDKAVFKRTQENYYFRRQVSECLDCFYDGLYGVLSIGDMEANIVNVRARKGRVIGEYSTIHGKICIVANAERTRTDIMFIDHYGIYTKNRNKLSRCVCL